MFRVIPIRVSLWRAGWVMLTIGLVAWFVSTSTRSLPSPGIHISLAVPSNGRAWAGLAFMYAATFVSGWLFASSTWSKWRDRRLVRAVGMAQPPTTRVRWTWTMKQLAVGVLFLVVGIWLSSVGVATVDDESSLILSVATWLSIIGMDYLILARRVGKLERGQGVVYYWQRQPGIFSFERVGVYTVPVHAVLW